MNQYKKTTSADDPTDLLTDEQIEDLASAKFFEIGSFEISAETTDDDIDAAVEQMFSKFESTFTK